LDDITQLTALELSDKIHRRQVSCVDVMACYLDRIDQLNPTFNAIVAMADHEVLLPHAKTADDQLAKGKSLGWLHGIPFAVKDLSDAAGFITSFGSPIYTQNIATNDSLPIRRIRSAGAIVIGKTNVPEFGLGSQSYNPVYGVTGNAHNPDWTSGGSSGGAATALAKHMLPVADGSDMMGSLRNPAAFNNVVGFRPTQGVIPIEGGDVFTGRLSTAGPMGRNVADTEALFRTMAGEDLIDPYSMRGELPRDTDAKHQNNRPARLGWLGSYNGYLPMEDGILELCESRLNTLDESIAAVESCMPDFSMAQLWDAWLVLRQWSVLGKYRALYESQRAKLKPELVWEIEQGLQLTAWDISQANVIRSNFYRAMQKLFGQHDFLALPSAQVFPFDKTTHWPETIGSTTMDTYHRWMEVVIAASLMGCPVINLPAGFSEGRPMGIQIMAPVGKDIELLAFAREFESKTKPV
jgi:amidase